MNDNYVNELENKLKVAGMQYNRVCFHYAQLHSFLYEVIEAFMPIESHYKKKAESLLSKTSDDSLEEYKAQIIKEYQDSLINKGG